MPQREKTYGKKFFFINRKNFLTNNKTRRKKNYLSFRGVS